MITRFNDYNLHYTQYPRKWIDGIFMGNADMGVMVWGNPERIHFTLDKMDFWEERMIPEAEWTDEHNWEDMKRMIKEGDHVGLKRKYEFYIKNTPDGLEGPIPTRLPVPRMNISLQDKFLTESFGKYPLGCEFRRITELKKGEGGKMRIIPADIYLDIEHACFYGRIAANDASSGPVSHEVKSASEESASYESGLGSNSISVAGTILSDRNFMIAEFSSDIAEISLGYDHLDDTAKKTLVKWGYPPLDRGTLDADNALLKRFGLDGSEISYVYQQMPENQGGLFISYAIIRNEKSIVEGMNTDISEKGLYPNGMPNCIVVVQMLSRNNLFEGDNGDKQPGPESNGLKDLFIEKALHNWEVFFEDLRNNRVLKAHLEFWNEYWRKNAVSIPDNIIENLYYIELYKLACNTKPGKYPIPLQGIWTIDGQMPPWLGDYHLDMNVQESYWGLYAANRLEFFEPLFRVMSSHIDKFKEYCRKFYGTDGILTTCAISLGGKNLKGYFNTEIWPGNGAWLAHMYWLYWVYTKDPKFLIEYAYPMIMGTFKLYRSLLEKNEYDEYYIPLSSSPEYYENDLKAWGKNVTVDIALILWLGTSLIEIYEMLKEKNELFSGLDGRVLELKERVLDELEREIDDIRDVKENLVYFPADYSGLMVFEDQPYNYPHRHMSHLFPIHPLHLVTTENDDDDRFLIHSSLKNLRKVGSWEYTGWTLPWLSIMGSWANNYWLAYRWIRDYFSFITPNSMHINGDPNDYGICTFVYEPMTLEAGFCFISSVNELLLKSWGGIIRIMEGLPHSWSSARFIDMRAEGAFIVSANLEEDNLLWAIVIGERGEKCRIKNRFVFNRSYRFKLYRMPAHVYRQYSEFKRPNGGDYSGFIESLMKEMETLEYNIGKSGDGFDIIEFDTAPGELYALIPYSAIEEDTDKDDALLKIDLRRALLQYHQWHIEGMPGVKKMYAGANWFGTKRSDKNPYLP